MFDHAAHHEATQLTRASWYRDRRPAIDETSQTELDAFDVVLDPVQARSLAYLRVNNPYEGTRVADGLAQLSTLVRERSLEPSAWLGFTWDHPDFVPAEQCDYNLGVVLGATSGPIEPPLSALELPSMTVARLDLRASGIDELVAMEMRALDWLYEQWLPTSGFEPTNHPTFEVWDADPTHSAENLTLHLPVTRLAAR